MVSGSVYGSRQIGAPGTVDRGAARIAAPASPVKQSRRQRASTHGETFMTHNARHRQRKELPTLFASVPKPFRLRRRNVNVYGEI